MANNKIQVAAEQRQMAGKPKSNRDNLVSLVNSYKSAIERAMPAVMTPERFLRLVTSAISATPKLAECDTKSFLGAMLTAAQLGMEPNTPLGQAYLIPYGNQVQFQLGYRGMIALAYRSKMVKSIQCQVVYSEDEFEYTMGTELVLRHKPRMSGDRGKPMCVYAVLHTLDGGLMADCMTWDEIMKFAARKSKSFRNGPWQTDPEEMAKKTVLKRLLKYAPLASDFARLVEQDGVVRNADSQAIEDGTFLDIEGCSVDEDTGEAVEPLVDTE